MANPQAVFGDDVISRIMYSMGSTASAKKLKNTARARLTNLILDLSGMAGCEPGKITRVAVCGNTAMHHLLLGLPVAQLVRAPYLPWIKDPVKYQRNGIGA